MYNKQLRKIGELVLSSALGALLAFMGAYYVNETNTRTGLAEDAYADFIAATASIGRDIREVQDEQLSLVTLSMARLLVGGHHDVLEDAMRYQQALESYEGGWNIIDLNVCWFAILLKMRDQLGAEPLDMAVIFGAPERDLFISCDHLPTVEH